MTTKQQQTAGGYAPPADSVSAPSSNVLGLTLRFGGVALIDAFSIWWIFLLLRDGEWFLPLVLGVIALGLTVFFVSDRMTTYRWFTPGLALMLLLVLYPTAFTVYVAFTNYGDGNLLTKPQALEILLARTYSPEDAATYDWTAFRNEAGETLLWLENDAGETFVTAIDQPLVPAAEYNLEIVGEPGDTPERIGDYTPVSPFVAVSDPLILESSFGVEPNIVQIPATGGDARLLEPAYTYDEAADTLTDNQTGAVYTPVDGRYTNAEGENIFPGYYVTVGLRNFQRLFATELFGGGEMVEVFVWTFVHAFLAVFVTFWLGLFLAIVLNNPLVPAKKILRSFILIPYAIPAFMSVLVWRGLLEPNFGVINDMLEVMSFGLLDFIPWRSSAFFARSAIILIQLWLGFPYMLLITTGALQSIPSDMYEAAEVDGASPLVQFWKLTLPLLLVAVGPLLIASFAFNFNNFTVIQLYLDGGPPISTTSVAGYTDILITYTYEVAFSSGRGADYGFATAITIVIFVLLTIVTFFNFRLTRRLEEISENV